MSNITAPSDRLVSLIVSGDRALFPRPEFRRDAVSYDIITPSAARGILDHIHWQPAIRWIVDQIHVLSPIRFAHEQLGGSTRIVLSDVKYLIEAHLELTEKAGPLEEPARHQDMFCSELRKKPRVRFGAADFPAGAEPADFSQQHIPIDETRDLGWMLHGPDYEDKGRLRFFRATMTRGVIPVSNTPERLFG